MVLLPIFIQPTFVIKNISTKTINVLGARIKPGTEVDLFAAIPGITESKVVEEMRIPDGDIYIESEVKGSIQIINSEIGTFQNDPDNNFVFTITDVQTSNYSASNRQVVRLNPTAGGFTVTLPLGEAGKQVVAKNVSDSANAITFSGTSSQLIDDQTNFIMSGARISYTFVFDGTGWMVV